MGLLLSGRDMRALYYKKRYDTWIRLKEKRNIQLKINVQDLVMRHDNISIYLSVYQPDNIVSIFWRDNLNVIFLTFCTITQTKASISISDSDQYNCAQCDARFKNIVIKRENSVHFYGNEIWIIDCWNIN